MRNIERGELLLYCCARGRCAKKKKKKKKKKPKIATEKKNKIR
jgi:hypothetical protein